MNSLTLLHPVFFNFINSGPKFFTALASVNSVFFKYSNFEHKILIYSTYYSFISFEHILSINYGSKTA